ncbi:hypothetical protein ACEQ8H_007998 [Pleosporales sp. CAS-2024a]
MPRKKKNKFLEQNCLCLFETLLRAGVDLNMGIEKVYGSFFLSLRFFLVQNPDIDAVRLFLKYGADEKAINPGSRISFLHTCFQFFERAEILEAILSAGADPNVKDEYGETLLHSLMLRPEIPKEDLASQRIAIFL